MSYALDSREHLIGRKVWWEVEVQGDVIRIVDPFFTEASYLSVSWVFKVYSFGIFSVNTLFMLQNAIE